MLTSVRDVKPGAGLGARLFIPEFIYFSWFIQALNIIQMKISFLDQHRSGKLPADAVSSAAGA